ncbi:MAG TPA: VacJ family lipoprotein [Rhizomicrobium sp.]|nr:VacJ family lipoprotein [Rhizomicrobium sp.]
MRGLRALVLMVCALAVSACAYGPPTHEALAARDPYEQMNRDTLKFNAKIDKYFVIPTVGLYFVLVPETGRKGVHNFLGNLSLPIIFVNDMLQGEVTRGAQSVGRFVINSSLGLGGFLDPATKMGIPGHGEDMGQTFAVWGAKEGPYLVLPFFGPSNPRDAAGLALDWTIDPTNFIHMKQHVWWAAGRGYFTLLDLRSQTWETVQGIQRNSVDYYASLRNFYRQYRNEQIRNGRAGEKPPELPDF